MTPGRWVMLAVMECCCGGIAEELRARNAFMAAAFIALFTVMYVLFSAPITGSNGEATRKGPAGPGRGSGGRGGQGAPARPSDGSGGPTGPDCTPSASRAGLHAP